ncbi:hypothetical protein AK812_SmicGene45817, partial [Symbiodinium microadriaticum]
MGTGSARLGIWRRPLGPSTGALHRQLDQSRAEPRPPGWVRKFEGTEQEAALHWPAGTAIGKLNLVLAEGKEPRIVLDSSVCGLNPAVHLPERVALPTGADVQRSFLSDDCFAQLCAVSLDFKAAHKCCKHRAWLYVGDLLLLLRLSESEAGAALTVALLGALNAPISWKKAQFAQQVVWCGWKFCFASESVELVANKLLKLREQLQALRAAHKVPRKSLEAALGLLNWATTFSKTPTGSWLPRNAQLLEVGALKEIHLRKSALCTACLSAADAFADKHRMGIGGWLSTARSFVWFSEIFSDEDVRQQWPQLSGSLQPYIGCFETLAQLALAQCSWQLLRSRHARFVLPSASDNTSAESGLNKLFSTAEPLGTFLRLAATWAHLHRVQFQVEHLAGEKNTWADAMSRGRIAFVQHRAKERVRISLAQLASASHSVTLHGHRTDWPACELRSCRDPSEALQLEGAAWNQLEEDAKKRAEEESAKKRDDTRPDWAVIDFKDLDKPLEREDEDEEEIAEFENARDVK